MRHYTSEQRQLFADQICTLVREWINDEANHFELDIKRGVEWRPDLSTGDRHPRSNPTATLILTVNGGAQESEGKPILPAPPVFRPPE